MKTSLESLYVDIGTSGLKEFFKNYMYGCSDVNSYWYGVCVCDV